jgi:hypothetical protein
MAALTFPTWVSALPHCRILVFGDISNLMSRLPGTVRARRVLGPPIDRDEVNLTYVDDFLQKTIDIITTNFLCVIMVDTILPEDFRRSVISLLEFYAPQGRQFAALGRRCPIARPNGSTDWPRMAEQYRQVQTLVSVSEVQNADYSNDFVLISMNVRELDFSEVLPFHFGMQEWDVWLGGWIAARVPTVAIGGRCGSFHIAHGPGVRMLPKMRDNVGLSWRRGGEVAVAVTLRLVLDRGKLIDRGNVVAVLSEEPPNS